MIVWEINCMSSWRSWLSFNHFSSNTHMQCVHLKHKECILNTRSVSNESQIDSEKLRENQRKSDQVQGVNIIKKSTSFEEPSPKNAMWVRSIFFSRKSFELIYSKSREWKMCVGDPNPFKDRSSEEITLFLSVDEILETDLSREQRFGTFGRG